MTKRSSPLMVAPKGLSESFVLTESNKSSKGDRIKTTDVKLDKMMGDKIKCEDDDRTASQGLIDKKSKDSDVELKVNGAVIR